MKAYVFDRYGTSDALRLEEVPTPEPAQGQVRIRIHAVSINGSDREALAGKPLYARIGGLKRLERRILGSDIAGRVEAVGPGHTEFAVGETVFGEIPGYRGGFAEYVCTHGRTLAPVPAGLSDEKAAAIPQGGVIAWNAVRTKGRVEPGQRVLINGGGGSGGTFAVQLARLDGAEVTGVDNAGKLDFMRSLGADHVIDYQQQDYTRGAEGHDLVLDLVAHRSVFANARALKRGGSYFYVGGSMGVLFQVLLFAPLIRGLAGTRMRVLSVPQNRADLLAITGLCAAGQVSPAIDQVFPFEQVPEAMRYVSEGQARGKVVVRVRD